MAFGFTLTVSRVGSVVNFDMTPWIYRQFFDRVSEDLALGLTLWLGASLIFISIISAVFFNAMDDRAQREGVRQPRPSRCCIIHGVGPSTALGPRCLGAATLLTFSP